MGCDIHSYAETKSENGKWEIVGDLFTDSWNIKNKCEHPFNYRSYSLFAFLAGVRNYDRCEPLSEPKGLPNDVCDDIKSHYDIWELDAHNASYLSLRELVEFDYDKEFWNRRVSKQIGPNSWTGAGLAEEGEGEIISYRNNLGESFFNTIEELKTIGKLDDVRVVFWFDN